MATTTGEWHRILTSKRTWLQAATLAGAIAFIIWRVDLGEAWRVVKSIAPAYAALGVLLLIASNVVHAKKWQQLLVGVGRVPFRDSLAVFWSAMTTNTVIPLRAGDVLRVQVMSQRTGLARPGILASLFTERLLDGVSFFLLLATAILIAGSRNYLNLWFLAVLSVFLVVVLATVVAARSMPGAEFERSPWLRLLPSRFRHRAADFIPHALDGIRPLGRVRSGVEVTAWAVLAWALEASAFVAWGRAFQLDVGFGALILVMVAVNLTSALTVLPANLGIFELTAVSVLRAAGASPAESTAYAVGTHLMIVATIAVIGVGTLLYLRLHVSDIFYLRRRQEAPEGGDDGEGTDTRPPAATTQGRR